MNRQYKIHRGVVFFVVVLLVFSGMLSTIIPWLATPKGRVYTGMIGYSSDYVQYVSYIKEGMYGRYTMLFRSFPFPQPATPIHFLYILLGVAGNAIGLSAPVVYHFSRIIFGLLFGFLVYRLFYRLFRSTTKSIVATILAFVSTPLGWLYPVGGHWVYQGLNFFNFAVNAPERIVGQPHYIFGSILFLSVLLLLFQKEQRRWRLKVVIIGLLSLGVGLVHTASGLLLLIVLFLQFGIRLIQNKMRVPSRQTMFLFLIAGFLTLSSLGIVYWSVTRYTLVPEIWLDSFVYGKNFTMIGFLQHIISFGPVMWVSILGFIFLLRKRQPLRDLDLWMTLWFIVQYGLFLFGFMFIHADRVRFLQTLYYIPTAYGAILFLESLSLRFGNKLFFFGLGCLLLLSIPTYVSDLNRSIHTYTNYQDFSIFVYPTVKQAEAFRYLDRSTFKESIVLSDYEVANLILLYSHNRVIGSNQGWSRAEGEQMQRDRTTFFSGTLDDAGARRYLHRYAIAYVYDGYQERFVGGNIAKYPFLHPVFTNNEVTVFRVEE